MKKLSSIGFFATLSLILFVASCTKEKYAPGLALELKPYLVYYEGTKYIIYDQYGNPAPNIPAAAIKQGDIQQYIDTVTNLKYTRDDKGDFWTAQYLNAVYKYPKAKASSYSGNDVNVSVVYDQTIGVAGEAGIDLGKAGEYTFTYTADDDGETTSRLVHLRVYNHFYDFDDDYYSMVSKIQDVGGAPNCLWLPSFPIKDINIYFYYGEVGTKSTTIPVDLAIDAKLSVNRFLNNSKLKGSIKGLEIPITNYPEEGSQCVVGAKKTLPNGDIVDMIELVLQGPIVGDDPQTPVVEGDAYTKSVKAANPGCDEDTITTLVILTNRTQNNITTGRIYNIPVQTADGKSVYTPLISIEYTIRRYKLVNYASNHETNDGRNWKLLESAGQNWTNTFRETFVKRMYSGGENKGNVINYSRH